MNSQFSMGQQRSIDSTFTSKVFTWMTFALALTGLTAYWVASTEYLINAILSSSFGMIFLIIAEIGAVIYLSARIGRMSAQTAIAVFLGYAILNGVTLSVILLAYTSASIASTFFITSGTFAVMAMIGYTTKQDLTSIGKISMMALIGIIIASIVNIFMKSPTLYWIVSYIGVVIFVGLVAYDTQKIKAMGNQLVNASEEEQRKYSILGALTLYLDFINLFLFLLRILGNRK